MDYKKYKAPESEVQLNPKRIRLHSVPNPRFQGWMSIVRFLESCKDVRKSVCVSCFGAKLYDKNGVEYKVDGRSVSLEDTKDIVEKIRKINAGTN